MRPMFRDFLWKSDLLEQHISVCLNMSVTHPRIPLSILASVYPCNHQCSTCKTRLCFRISSIWSTVGDAFGSVTSTSKPVYWPPVETFKPTHKRISKFWMLNKKTSMPNDFWWRALVPSWRTQKTNKLYHYIKKKKKKKKDILSNKKQSNNEHWPTYLLRKCFIKLREKPHLDGRPNVGERKTNFPQP